MSDKNLQTEKESTDVRVTLVGARLAFTDALYEAKAFKAGDKKRFSCKLLVPKDSPMAAELKKAMAVAATREFGDEANKQLTILKAENKLCLTDGDIKDYDGYQGMYVLSASAKTRPTLLGPKKEQLTEKDGILYSGVYVIAKVGIWAQNNDWGKRINCNLRGLQFFRPGEAFSGSRPASEDEFDEVAVEGGNTLSADNANFM